MWMPKYAAYEAGLVVSRQNGKGAYLEARALAGLFLLGERLIAWTAHEMPTAKEGFQRLESLITDNPELKKEVRHIHYSNGNEGIELKTGQRVIFKTRTKKALRGFTVDALIMDEAMILDPDMMAAMMFAVSARPNAQLIYTGSAGDEDSIQFGRVRSKAIEGTDPRVMFMEWSADVCDEFCRPDCDEHDAVDAVETYAKANPGLGYRIEVDNVHSERMSMDRERFCRERLSVGTWPVDGDAWSVIPQEAWQNRFDELSRTTGPVFVGIDTSPNLKWTTLVACGAAEQGGTHVEITGDGMRYDHRPGTDWVVPRCVEMWKRNRRMTFVIDEGSQARRYIDELVKAGVPVESPKMREYAAACGRFYTSVVPSPENTPDLWHLNQPALTDAVAGAGKRELADLWAWDKRNATSEISPLVAATLALWAYDKNRHTKKARPAFAFG